MSTDNNTEPAWLLVTRREVVSRITDKSFLIGTALMVAMLVGFIGFTAWQDERTDEVTLAATPDAVAMADVIVETAPDVDDKVDVTVLEVDDADAAETALRESEADAWLHPADDGWQLTSESSEQESLTEVTRSVVRQAVLAENAAGAGNTALARIQLLIYLAVGLVGLSFTPYKSFVPALSGPTAWFIGFFFAGFVALACLWAVAGSLASRTEDLQATSTPLTMLMLVMFFGGVSLDGRAQVIASFVPPVSAVVMPKRILAGGVEWWEPLLALGLLAAFAAITVWVGERLYRRALLQTGGRDSLRQAWAAAE